MQQGVEHSVDRGGSFVDTPTIVPFKKRCTSVPESETYKSTPMDFISIPYHKILKTEI
jgi:hypothetical protein